MDLNRTRTRTTRIAVGAAFLAAATAAAGATPASADPAYGTSHQLRVLCGAAGGDFHAARFGYWRCQDARLDGMGTFWAARSLCERAAGRTYLEATSIPEVGRGTWVCAPNY
ncbi:hypothetical protein [Nocardioides astragali]|uniref:Secreted protein n=1 Tax=Nocardioides astragali TaxID=1776736 RepID=A0ABW2MY41_9ACTN|nr:hypothetical protein [Nocardioides astragali]